MKKDMFIRELEYLLQDIPENDREEAISYYRDYLDEAGPEREEAVLAEFGSPERIAAIIRAELSGNLKDGGSFTDVGYDDERFRDPNFQVAKRLDLPEEAPGMKHADGYGFNEKRAGGFRQAPPFYTEAGQKNSRPGKKPWTNRGLKIFLWIVLLLVASPFLVGAAGIGFGLVAGFLSLVGGLLLALVVLTVAALVAGIVFGVFGAVAMILPALSAIDGLFLVGVGILSTGCGLLGLTALLCIFVRLLPLVWKGIRKLWNRCFQGRKERRAA